MSVEEAPDDTFDCGEKLVWEDADEGASADAVGADFGPPGNAPL